MRDRFAADSRFAGLDFTDRWNAARPVVGATPVAPDFDYALPAASALRGGGDGWTDTAAIPLDDIDGDVEGTAVWTGSEMVYFGDFHKEAYRYDQATDHWQTTSTLGGPLGLRDTTAVWTGTYVVASNGCTANNHNGTTSLAWRYDPVVDVWESIANAPISRTDQSAVWTGTEMLVWGGRSGNASGGGRYDPSTNTWSVTSVVDAPLPARSATGVWSGSEMIVSGGIGTWNGYRHTGGVYVPVASMPTDGIFANGFEPGNAGIGSTRAENGVKPVSGSKTENGVKDEGRLLGTVRPSAPGTAP